MSCRLSLERDAFGCDCGIDTLGLRPIPATKEGKEQPSTTSCERRFAGNEMTMSKRLPIGARAAILALLVMGVHKAVQSPGSGGVNPEFWV